MKDVIIKQILTDNEINNLCVKNKLILIYSFINNGMTKLKVMQK